MNEKNLDQDQVLEESLRSQVRIRIFYSHVYLMYLNLT